MNKKPIATLFIVTAIALSACSAVPPAVGQGGSQTSGTVSASAYDDCFLELVPTAEVVDTHTPLQKSYLSGGYNDILSYANGTSERSLPKAIKLQWSTDFPADKYIVELSEGADFSAVTQYTTLNTSYNLYNLYIGQNYYWRVRAVSGDAEMVSQSAYFQTSSAAPRNMFVDGITNVRDLGGWVTESGKRVKQGLLYRTGRLNTSWYATVNADITEFGIKTMRETMGIRSEIDLRKDYQNEVSLLRKCVLGDDINYYACPMEYEDLTSNKDMVRHIFSLLADKSNYPLFFHCDIGTDRTGFIAFLVNGLLGVPEEDLYREYLFSNFGRIGGSRSVVNIQNAYVNAIKGYAGNSLSEKINGFLLDWGVAQADIDSVREILSEE